MTFAQAQTYLRSIAGERASPRMPDRLERMRALLAALGNPQQRYPTIQIGGTSGKGSTSSMVASALVAAGSKTGLHTKPHIRSVTERVRVDGTAISEERFGELLSETMPVLDAIDRDYSRPSYYETLLALAFLSFAQDEVDVAVIEVGIGGKLDGTNVLVPRVCAITNVGLDHTDILGDTIEEIAADKAGIAKPGVPLVCGVEQPIARAIVESACAQAGAPFIALNDVARVNGACDAPFSQIFTVNTPQHEYHIELPVLGAFQQKNAAAAVAILEQLGDLAPDVESVQRGLASVNIIGRMEYFPSHPAIVFDIAHNPDKAHHLAEGLEKTFGAERHYTFIIAIGESKDAREILLAFAHLRASFMFTSFEEYGRTATKPQRLASIAEVLGLWGRAIPDPVEALSIARRNASADDIVVVTGSTYVVAELRAWWMEHVAAAQS